MSDNTNLVEEIHRLHGQFGKLRILALAAYYMMEYESRRIYACIRKQEDAEAYEKKKDIRSAIHWLQEEIVDFPLVAGK